MLSFISQVAVQGGSIYVVHQVPRLRCYDATTRPDREIQHGTVRILIVSVGDDQVVKRPLHLA